MVVLGLALVIAVVLALPVADWRSRRGDIEPLTLAPAGAHAVRGRKIWIDTDAACGTSRTTDPDDCLALLAMLKAPGLRVVGISTIFGNAAIGVTDRTTRELVSLLASEGFTPPPVFRGRSSSLDGTDTVEPTLAENAIRSALTEAPMTIVALGPGTCSIPLRAELPACFSATDRIQGLQLRQGPCGRSKAPRTWHSNDVCSL